MSSNGDSAGDPLNKGLLPRMEISKPPADSVASRAEARRQSVSVDNPPDNPLNTTRKVEPEATSDGKKKTLPGSVHFRSQQGGLLSSVARSAATPPPHNLSKTVPISIPPPPAAQVKLSPSPSENAMSPSTPPLGPSSPSPPQRLLSTAATAALEARRCSIRDSSTHSPSPSRRRPPLSPSSSSGALTPPRGQALSPSKPFRNPYTKTPYRVTGFSPGSAKAPVASGQLSAETESVLLQATERGLFSDDEMEEGGWSEEKERAGNRGDWEPDSTERKEGKRRGGGVTAVPQAGTDDGGRASGSHDAEKGASLQESARGDRREGRRSTGVEGDEQNTAVSRPAVEASDRAVENSKEETSPQVRKHPKTEANRTADDKLADVSLTERSLENEPQQAGAGSSNRWRTLEVRDRPKTKQSTGAFQVKRTAGDEMEQELRTERSSDSEPEQASQPPITLEPGLSSESAVSHEAPRIHSSEGNKRAARDRWRRARLQLAAARAFAYNLGGFSEVSSGEAGSRGQASVPKGSDDVSTSMVGSLSSAASITQPTGGTPESDVSQERGRKRFEGIVVKEDRTWAVALSDLYIAALKAPILKFSIGVFLTPALLSLLFVPLYLLDLRGFEFEDGLLPKIPNPCNPLTSSDWLRGRPLCGQKTGWVVAYSVCYLFLYSLSLSTMFGGAPVQARSRYTLLVANLQTLVAQFAFVFLSGAVFSRLSQRSQPIRGARKAVFKLDDVTGEDGDESERYRVFATRLVLKGPMPCVLVDVRIKLAFRIFVQQRNGSNFCSTSGLDLVRPEVAYLEYGIMIKHVIDRNSPLYGHTEESLLAGDASFSLTVMGTERASLLSMFHMQDYFMSDGDVVWDGDFYNFVSIDSRGIRTVDHSQLDTINVFRAAAHVPRVITRMRGLVKETEAKGAWIRARQQQATTREEGSSSKRMQDREPSQSVDEPKMGEVEDIYNGVRSQEEASGSGKNIGEEHVVEIGAEAMRQELRGTVKPGTREDELQMEKEDDPSGGLAGLDAGSSPGAGSSHGLTQEDLQGLRQRKIDREGRGGRRRSELGEEGAREGAWVKAHRYNAGF